MEQMMRVILLLSIMSWLAIPALAQTSADYDALVQSADMQLKVGNAPIALSLSTTAIKMNTGRWEAHGLAAKCLMILKRYAEAVKEFDVSATNAPKDRQAELKALRNRCVLAEMGPQEPNGPPAPPTQTLGTANGAGAVEVTAVTTRDLLHSYVPIRVGTEISMHVEAADGTKAFDTSVLFYRRTTDSDGSETFEMDTRGLGSDGYRFAKDGLFEDVDGESPLHLIALPMTSGYHWEQVIAERCRGCDTGPPERESTQQFRIISSGNPCSPPGGATYDECLVIEEDEQTIRERGKPINGAALRRTVRYYVRNIGLVEEEVFNVTAAGSARASLAILKKVSIDEDAARERRDLEDTLKRLHPSRWP
jgi:hypothetical protein